MLNWVLFVYISETLEAKSRGLQLESTMSGLQCGPSYTPKLLMKAKKKLKTKRLKKN